MSLHNDIIEFFGRYPDKLSMGLYTQEHDEIFL